MTVLQAAVDAADRGEGLDQLLPTLLRLSVTRQDVVEARVRLDIAAAKDPDDAIVRRARAMLAAVLRTDAFRKD